MLPFEVVKITPWADKNGTSFEALPSSSREWMAIQQKIRLSERFKLKDMK